MVGRSRQQWLTWALGLSMSFVWLPAIVLELGSQADRRLCWKRRQQVSLCFLSGFSTQTRWQLLGVRISLQQSHSPRQGYSCLCLANFSLWQQTCTSHARDAWICLRLEHALLSSLGVTWATNKGWSWPMLPPFDMSQSISNPQTQTFTQATGEHRLSSSNNNRVCTLPRDSHRKWQSQLSETSSHKHLMPLLQTVFGIWASAGTGYWL